MTITLLKKVGLEKILPHAAGKIKTSVDNAGIQKQSTDNKGLC